MTSSQRTAEEELALLEHMTAQPCLLYADDRDCPACQAQKALELRRAVKDD